MQFLLDNLLAVVVATVLVGLLTVATLRQQSESVSLAEHHFTAGRSMALSDWLRSDLQSLTAVTAHSGSRLVFTRSTDPSSATTSEVEYALVCDGAAPSRCRVVRREAGAERVVGPNVSAFSVTLLTAAGQPTLSPALTTALKVRVLTPAQLTGSASTNAAVWERTFTPRMLAGTTV